MDSLLGKAISILGDLDLVDSNHASNVQLIGKTIQCRRKIIGKQRTELEDLIDMQKEVTKIYKSLINKHIPDGLKVSDSDIGRVLAALHIHVINWCAEYLKGSESFIDI